MAEQLAKCNIFQRAVSWFTGYVRLALLSLASLASLAPVPHAAASAETRNDEVTIE